MRTRRAVRLVSHTVRGGAIREEAGLRQADISGLSARQVSRIEAGSGTPRQQTLHKLAAAHSLTVSEYLERVAERLEALPRARGVIDPLQRRITPVILLV